LNSNLGVSLSGTDGDHGKRAFLLVIVLRHCSGLKKVCLERNFKILDSAIELRLKKNRN